MRAMNPWEWITTTTSVEDILTTLGLGGLALLFSQDRIITRGQHLRRTADLEKFHARELAEKDARIADIRDSRDAYKEAARVERERADKATDAVGEMAPAMESVLHVLVSLDRALPSPMPNKECAT